MDEIAFWWTTTQRAEDANLNAQMFHQDRDRLSFLKFFIFLTDVTPETGPHVYLKGSHRKIPWGLRKDGRISDESVRAAGLWQNVVELFGPAGTVMAVDTIGLHKAIEEALRIGREANIPVHIAHIKALGVDVHGQAPAIIAMIEAAQRAGQVVHADQYAWSASHTSLSAALIPRSAQDGGRDAMLRRFNDGPSMESMRSEIAENLRRRGGAASLLVTSGPADAQGKTLEAVAKEQGVDPVVAAIEILKQSEARVASFNQNENDIAAFMLRPWVVTSSDATLGHPRYYGSFARKYTTYVKDKKVMSLQAFIDQSTAAAAAMFSLEGRGQLKVGAFADVIAFDPKSFAPRADYANPFLLATGMRTVVVNGKVAIDNGAPTGVAAGRPLPRQPIAGTCR